ncbi:HupE/UreJ family protein [Nocardioides sp.]|uniref:HupE/UreJ family protein n=1 Tax=Nocardioides sp. TaxID=35761 RepID=UPI0039E607DE
MTCQPAQAHGFTTVTYVDVTAPRADHVRAELGLEYDLMLVSVADTQGDDPFYQQGQPAWEDADYPGMEQAIADHRDSLLAYVTQRFSVTYGGHDCTATLEPDLSVALNQDQGVPYATITLDYACPHDEDAEVLRQGHVIGSSLFPDSEGYVRDAKTIVTYELDDRTGSAALDASNESFSTKQSWERRFWEFYRLGVEHLLTGLDHLLFLTALIVGSRRLREVVLAASMFTLAHSTTLVLAAFGLVHVSSGIVEPLIALSIAATAAWYLWLLWRRRDRVLDLDTTSTSHFALDRAGWSRLAVVFCFGLVHGLGFAGALGIDYAWSWSLLWSLVVFNVGIETVQLALIAVVFPILVLLRRTAPGLARWLTGLVAVGVSIAGLVWFFQRILG